MIKKVLGSILLTLSLMANDVVVDPETGLMWQDTSKIIKKNWNNAKNYCTELTLAKYSNWRLPHLGELMSITDRSKYKSAIKSIFKPRNLHFLHNYWWSNTAYIYDTSKAWSTNFEGGTDFYYNKLEIYNVRCVRDTEE